MRSDSPPPSWYEPDDSWDDADDQESEPTPAEPVAISYGWATWTRTHDIDD